MCALFPYQQCAAAPVSSDRQRHRSPPLLSFVHCSQTDCSNGSCRPSPLCLCYFPSTHTYAADVATRLTSMTLSAMRSTFRTFSSRPNNRSSSIDRHHHQLPHHMNTPSADCTPPISSRQVATQARTRGGDRWHACSHQCCSDGRQR